MSISPQSPIIAKPRRIHDPALLFAPACSFLRNNAVAADEGTEEVV
jgi:hypothetical protein